MFEHLFFPEASPLGWQKKALLNQHRIVCLDQPNNPSHRVTWETVQKFIAEHKDALVQQMRLCAEDSELAEQYDRITNAQWGVDIVFNGVVVSSLPQLFPDYQPENGMDADIFLIIDDEDRPVYHIEFFPREVSGQMVTAYGSKFQFTIPFMTSRDKKISDDLGGIIFGGVGAEGEQLEEATDRWMRLERGLWKIIERESVMMFLHSACFSHIEHTCPEPKEMISAGFARSTDDRSNTRAIFGYTQSQ